MAQLTKSLVTILMRKRELSPCLVALRARIDGLQIYILGSIEQLDVETMQHFEADVRFIRASEEYRMLGRHPDPDRTSAVGYQGIRFGLANSLL